MKLIALLALVATPAMAEEIDCRVPVMTKSGEVAYYHYRAECLRASGHSNTAPEPDRSQTGAGSEPASATGGGNPPTTDQEGGPGEEPGTGKSDNSDSNGKGGNKHDREDKPQGPRGRK